MKQELNIVLPSGSLKDNTLKLMKEAGYDLSESSRSYTVTAGGGELKIRLLRAQEVATYVERGKFDAGITGLDWILESNSRVVELADLPYSKQINDGTRWVLAAPKSGELKSVGDLEGKVVATELVNLARSYFKKQGVEVEVEFSWGATESKTPDLVDAIIDVTETGSSLRANNLSVLDTVLFTTPRFIANEKSLQSQAKREGLEDLAQNLRSVINARGRVKLELNVSVENLEGVSQLLPTMQAPDVTRTADSEWLKLSTVAEESKIKLLLPELQRRGARGILISKLDRVLPDNPPEARLL